MQQPQLMRAHISLSTAAVVLKRCSSIIQTAGGYLLDLFAHVFGLEGPVKGVIQTVVTANMMASFLYSLVSPLLNDDGVSRSPILYFICAYGFAFDAIIVLRLHRWASAKWNHLRPRLRWTVFESALFSLLAVLSLSILKNTISKLDTNSTLMPIFVVMEIIFAVVVDLGTLYFKFVIANVVGSLHDELYRTVTEVKTPVYKCHLTILKVQEANDLLQEALQAILISCVSVLLGQLAGELPLAECNYGTIITIISSIAIECGAFSVLVNRASAFNNCIRHFRREAFVANLRRGRNNVSDEDLQMQVILAAGSKFGLSCDGQTSFNWRTWIDFLGSWISVSFLLYQLVLNDAMHNWDQFCEGP